MAGDGVRAGGGSFRGDVLRRWVKGYGWFTFAALVVLAVALSVLGFK